MVNDVGLAEARRSGWETANAEDYPECGVLQGDSEGLIVLGGMVLMRKMKLKTKTEVKVKAKAEPEPKKSAGSKLLKRAAEAVAGKTADTVSLNKKAL